MPQVLAGCSDCCDDSYFFGLAARISALEDEARQQKQALSKAEAEKRQLQEKLTDQEKVTHTNSGNTPLFIVSSIFALC